MTGVPLIRRAAPTESDAVARLFRDVRDACLPWLPALHTPEADRWFFRERVFPSCDIWVAGTSRLDGFCAFRSGWVDHLYVRPDCHGRGIGSALLAQAMRTHAPLSLHVFQRNTHAIRFYEAHGFRLVCRYDGAATEEGEPDALYAWPA